MSKYTEGFFTLPVTITFGALCSMREQIEALKAENKRLRERVRRLTLDKCLDSFDWFKQPSKHYLLRCKK